MVLVGGLVVVGVLAAVLAVPFGLFVSWPVTVFAVVGTLGASIAARLSGIATAVLTVAIVLLGIGVMGADSYVQYGSVRFWSAPALIHSCGMTLRPSGRATDLSDGDGPVYRHIWTTPAGNFVYGVSGCDAGGDPYVVGVGRQLIVYRVSS